MRTENDQSTENGHRVMFFRQVNNLLNVLHWENIWKYNFKACGKESREAVIAV